jgi:hypothetical protein
VDLIAKGNSYISSQQNAANQLLDKVFKVRLGRGFYGECLVTISLYILHACIYLIYLMPLLDFHPIIPFLLLFGQLTI